MVGGEQPGLTVKYEGIDQPGIYEDGLTGDVEYPRVEVDSGDFHGCLQ